MILPNFDYFVNQTSLVYYANRDRLLTHSLTVFKVIFPGSRACLARSVEKRQQWRQQQR